MSRVCAAEEPGAENPRASLSRGAAGPADLKGRSSSDDDREGENCVQRLRAAAFHGSPDAGVASEFS